MYRLQRAQILVACAAILGACGIDRGIVDPTPTPVDPVVPETFSVFSVYPRSVELEQGEEIQLALDARNARGFPITALSSVSYSSSSAAVASVSRTGLVTAISPGTAVISTSATVGAVTAVTSTTVTVRQPIVSDNLVLSAQSTGWQPTPAHVAAGRTVEWRGGHIAVSGAAVTTVYLMDDRYSFIDSLNIGSGSATRNFTTPGTFRYCSNACWDPPEFGVIIVH